MYLTGFADEASKNLATQIKVTKTLGWKNIESRGLNGSSLPFLTDEEFEKVREELDNAAVRVNCFGSTVANWAKPLGEPPDSSYDELERAIPRMHALGTKMIRVMSFQVPEDGSIDDPEVVEEVIRRAKVLARMAEDGGIMCVHENCNTWAGRSYEHTLRLLDAVQSPAFKLVFDTGNPVFRRDVRGEPPYPYQNALDFYQKVKEHVAYIHIKDGKMIDDKMQFSFPAEGDGYVAEILGDLHARGYDGGISIEPHMAAVFHDDSVKSKEEVMLANYVEYGKRMETLVVNAGWSLPRGVSHAA